MAGNLGPKPRMNVAPGGAGGVTAPGGGLAFYDGPVGTIAGGVSAPTQSFHSVQPATSPFPNQAQGNMQTEQVPSQSVAGSGFFGSGTLSYEEDPFNEPPLLEELGINVENVVERMKGVAFFKRVEPEVLEDLDLSGPLAIILALGTCLLLAGKITFSYVYGFGVSGTVLLWSLINLMSQKGGIDMYRTASVLGYGLIPMVIMAMLAVFISLQSTFGSIVAIGCIAWSTATASRFFATANAMQQQRWLVAYPVGLFYTVFSLLTIF